MKIPVPPDEAWELLFFLLFAALLLMVGVAITLFIYTLLTGGFTA